MWIRSRATQRRETSLIHIQSTDWDWRKLCSDRKGAVCFLDATVSSVPLRSTGGCRVRPQTAGVNHAKASRSGSPATATNDTAIDITITRYTQAWKTNTSCRYTFQKAHWVQWELIEWRYGLTNTYCGQKCTCKWQQNGRDQSCHSARWAALNVEAGHHLRVARVAQEVSTCNFSVL